ncbi:MAG: transcription-repair coupling factor [Alphaproteobacteria bacterium]
MKINKYNQNIFSQVSNGYIPKILCDIVKSQKESVLFIASDDKQAKNIISNIAFFDKTIEVINIPAWDCLPFDRCSPNPEIMAMRCSGLSNILYEDKARIIVTTTNSIVQKVPPKHIFKNRVKKIQVGANISLQELTMFLNDNSYLRTETVRQQGNYAVRGGIVDIFPPNYKQPFRMDFWGDEIESIREFDSLSQKSLIKKDKFYLCPVNEIILNSDTINNFKQNYRKSFGARSTNDFLYDSISQGIPFQGYEHWLSFYYNKLETIFDYLKKDTILIFGEETQSAFNSRLEEISDYYLNRKTIYEQSKGDNNALYRPVDADKTYLNKSDWDKNFNNRTTIKICQNPLPDNLEHIDIGIKKTSNFTIQRVKNESVIKKLIDDMIESKKNTVIACESIGSLERIKTICQNQEFETQEINSFNDIKKNKKLKLCVLSLEYGFSYGDIEIFSESDLFGEKLGQAKKRTKKSDNFIQELSEIEVGDYVVHINSGIGRYEGLETIELNRIKYDCLKISYSGSDVLFVPVENMDALSRFGSAGEKVVLDKLGGYSWQARKAKTKERLGEMATKLIDLASKRKLKKSEIMPVPIGLYDEFVAEFPFTETKDQEDAIKDIIDDLASGIAMERLICGDVGFGKTEIALRATFIAVMNGFQVAIVAPTTLLARQHYKNFTERFKNFPVKIGHLSRLVSPKDTKLTKQGLQEGSVDIVVGTHGIFAKSTKYKNLGLLVIDEEQHFGVSQKETLKEMKKNVHIMSLSATPIPRTLQMSLSGVRDLSIIATPPIDRLTIRTFTMPYDGFIIKEAIMRERFRGGQVYYVVPRLSDLDIVFKNLKTLVPNMNIAVAHGSIPAKELDQIMTDFTDGKYDILLATNIIESGIDVQNANTMIVHRADMFGLSQLYQLRGRIGRGKIRAYCYLTTRSGKVLSNNSRKRLDVIQTIDSLGAGFNIASHDLNIRGAGNLLGDEQSGHIKEIGIELYQKMLQEAMEKQTNSDEDCQDLEFIPNISIGISIYIPDSYISGLSERLSFYRRLANVQQDKETDEIAIEMVDRYGKLPKELENLFFVVNLKTICRRIRVEKVILTEKGLLLSFYKNKFIAPEKLIEYMQNNMGLIRIRPDHKLEISKIWKTESDRLKGVKKILTEIEQLCLTKNI